MQALITSILLLLAAHPSHAQVDKALAYLATEVSRWSKDNQCFSCHNNGDGARALYIAMQVGKRVDLAMLKETAAWLNEPALWKTAGANPGISDKTLAGIQYASALAESKPRNRKTLLEAAAVVAEGQSDDGSWKIDELGSPASYGTALATYFALNTLKLGDPNRFAKPIAHAQAWFAALQPSNVPEAAAAVMAGQKGLAFLLEAQNSNGGWGPWKLAPSEPFDTALAILAIKNERNAVERGRAFLLRTQLASGGWPATTRPPDGQSYAQHISTTAWAVIALLRTETDR